MDGLTVQKFQRMNEFCIFLLGNAFSLSWQSLQAISPPPVRSNLRTTHELLSFAGKHFLWHILCRQIISEETIKVFSGKHPKNFQGRAVKNGQKLFQE